MQNKFSGAITLGYASLFISAWIFSISATGWIQGAKAGLPFIMLFGAILVIAGIFSFYNEASKIDTVLFLVVGAADFSYSLRFILFPNLQANTSPAGVDGWITILIAVVIFYLWLSSFKGNIIRQLFFLGLWLTYLSIAIANWFTLPVFNYIGGYIGLITSLLAGWYSASTVMIKKVSGSPQPTS